MACLTPNALGLLVEQTDAKGQTTRFTFDVLGRALTRIDDADAPNPQDRTTIWTYDTAATGIGKLADESLPGYTATYTYDSFGRPISTDTVVDFTTFTSSTTYDGFGRVEDTTYPSGVTVRNVYNLDGHLEAVTDTGGTVEYWKALEQDARGNIQKFRLGNGIESTRLHDALTGRLESVLSTDAGTTFQDFTYDFKLLYKPVESWAFYASYTHGLKSGHFNAGLLVNPDRGGPVQSIKPVKPEYIDAVEIGLKLSGFDDTMTLKLAAFRYWYTDLQIFDIVNSEGEIPPRSCSTPTRKCSASRRS